MGSGRRSIRLGAALLWLWAGGAGAGEPFVTVDLTDLYHGRFIGAEMGDGYGIAEGQLPAAGSRVEVGGIPFLIGTRESGDHLDVGLARWPDVEQDPVGFYSHYKPDGYGDPECPVVRIPRQNYSGLYLLCLADTDPAKTPVVSFRLGLHDGHGILYDSAVRCRGGTRRATSTSWPTGPCASPGRRERRRAASSW